MSEKSHIEWTDATWNPVLGCSKISPGCKNCYAIRTTWRLQHNPNPTVKAAFEGLTILQGGEPNWTGKVRLVEERLREPLKWGKGRRIFVNSQSDLFHEELSDAAIQKVFKVMCEAKQHVFQVLTKRPERMREFLSQWDSMTRDFGPLWPNMWPQNHVWLGTSVESPKYKDRIDQLRETPAAARFLSLEPLLEDLGTIDLTGIHWCIVGGESGPRARPMHPDWARSIRDQCKAAGVPFFFKQWGEWAPQMQECAVSAGKCLKSAHFNWNVGATDAPINSDCRVSFKVGKKAAGRLLDGIEHSAYPQLKSGGQVKSGF